MHKNKRWLLTIGALITSLSLTTSGFISPQISAAQQVVIPQNLSPTGIPTSSEKLAVFNRIWGLFNANYVFFQAKGINWNAEKSQYEPQALAQKTWPQFFAVVDNMIASLHDDHSELIGAPLPPLYYPPIVTTWLGRQLIVSWSKDPKKIPIGSIIVSVDHQPLWQLKNQLPYSTISLDPLKSDVNQPIVLGLWNPNTLTTTSVTLPVTSFSKGPAFYPFQVAPTNRLWDWYPGFTYGKPIGTDPNSIRVAQMPDGILYVYVPYMYLTDDTTSNGGKLQQQFAQVIKLAQKAKGMVLDLRGNGGGFGIPAIWFAQHFYTKTESPLQTNGRIPDPENDTVPQGFTAWQAYILNPLTPHLSLPVALLTNDQDASAAEMLTVSMGTAPNVQSFGTTTSGMLASPNFYQVMKGVNVQISALEFVTSSGQQIEGVGITPDHIVEYSYSQLVNELHRVEKGQTKALEQGDPVLQSALTWLHQKINVTH